MTVTPSVETPAAVRVLASTVYKGRTIEVTEEVKVTEALDENSNPTYVSNGNRRVVVNGSRQFSFKLDTDPAFILAETKRVIDAQDAEAERFRQIAEAGGYVPVKTQNFAHSWAA